MNLRHLIYICVAGLLALLQEVFFSAVDLFGMARVFVYPFLLLLLPVALSQMSMLAYGFGTGILVDILCGTPGLHTATFTSTAFMRRYIARLFLDKNEPETLPPCMGNMGVRFLLFPALLCLWHVGWLSAIDACSLFSPLYLLKRWLAGSLLTYLFMVLLYYLIPYNKSN